MEYRRLGRTGLKVAPLCLEQGVGVIPYSPLAGGFLSGKYRRDRPLPESERAAGVRGRYMNERGFALLDRVDEVAAAHGATVAGVSLAWLLARPGMTAPIIGANSVDQLRETLPAWDLALTPREITALDKVSDWKTRG